MTADVSYLRWTQAPVARTIEVIPGTLMVDVDGSGYIVGVETVGRAPDPADPWRILRAVRLA